MAWAPLSLKNLTNALRDVDDWQGLGIQLDIDYHELQKFANEHRKTEEQKRAMLQFWLDKEPKASWEILLSALGKLNLRRAAEEIEQAYRIPSSTQSKDGPLLVPTVTTQSENVTTVASFSTPPSHQPEHIRAKDIDKVDPISTATNDSHQPKQTSAKAVWEVQLEIKKLVALYDDLVENSVETLSEMQENSPNFFRKLRRSVAVLPTSLTYQHSYFLEHHSSQIAKSTTVEEIFSILSRYCNFLNCSLLVHIINKFGNYKLKQQLSSYAETLQEFRSQTKITDFMKVCAENPQLPSICVALKAKMSPEWEHCTLEDAEEYRNAMAQNSSLADYVLSLVKGDSGSIFLIWSAPEHAVRFVAAAMNSEFLQRHGIEEVTIDGENLEEYKHQYDLVDPKFKMISQHVDELSEGLVWASREGCLEEVVFLLSTGVEVNSRGQWEGRTALMQASQGGHLGVVKELVGAQADVDQQDEDGWTALKLASDQGHTEVVQLLLSRRAQVDLQSKDGGTALMRASDEGHTDVVQLLLSSGAQVDLQSKYGWTALMLASEEGHTDVVQLLLSHGAQVELQEMNGWTALTLASVSGLTGVVQLLLSSGAQVDLQNKYGWTALMLASDSGHTAVVQLLLTSGAQVNLQDAVNGWTALMCASNKGHTGVVQQLLSSGAQVDLQDTMEGWTALMLASDKGHTGVVQQFLSSGAQVDLQDTMEGFTALMLASDKGHTGVVQQLLSSGAQVDLQNMNSWTALMLASVEGHTDVVQLLLSSGAQVNLKHMDGWTALMFTSKTGHTDVVQLLLSSGAQVDLKHINGWTALMLASDKGHTGVVQLLLSSGAQVDLQAKNGLTALILAVMKGHTETVKTLLTARADVNLQDETSGRSAVFHGAEKNYLEIVKLLIQSGADLRLKDKDGVTADEVAEVHGRHAVCEELRKHIHGDHRPLSKVVRDRVLATGQVIRAYFNKLGERILKTQKKELARRAQDLHPKMPLPSTPSRSSKGVRGLRKKKNIPKHPHNVSVFMSP